MVIFCAPTVHRKGVALCRKAWSVSIGDLESLHLSKSVGKTGLSRKYTSRRGGGGSELTFCRQGGQSSLSYVKEVRGTGATRKEGSLGALS